MYVYMYECMHVGMYVYIYIYMATPWNVGPKYGNLYVKHRWEMVFGPFFPRARIWARGSVTEIT